VTYAPVSPPRPPPRLSAAVYNPFVLKRYDLWVTRFVWRCPADRQIAHYRAHLRPRHLDVGVGVGGRSFVRQALDAGFPGQTLGGRAVVADVMLTGLKRDAWHRFNGRSAARQMSHRPLAGTEMFQLQAPIPLEGDVDLSAVGLRIASSIRWIVQLGASLEMASTLAAPFETRNSATLTRAVNC
jgi:hypothetical protein